jgi:glutaredoxin
LCKKKKKTNDGGNSILKFIVQEHSITEETAVSSSSVSSIDNNTFQPCPVCGKLINTSNPITINLHLDACLNSQHKPYQKQKKSKKTKLSITVPQTKHFLSN